MATIVNAVFDGSVFRPTGPVALPADTEVRLEVSPVGGEAEPVTAGTEPSVPGIKSVELIVSPKPKTGEPWSFLRVAESLKLEGPPDWATNIDHYLYGHEKTDGK